MPTWLATLLAYLGFAVLIGLFLRGTVLGRGLSVPLVHLFRKPVTTQYPEVKRPPQDRFHGRHQLNRYPDGLEKCIGCELCAWACPADAIYVQGEDNTDEARYSPGERYAVDYQINYNRCILCGLCIEACPTRALTMTPDYEISAGSRQDLIWTKDLLLAGIPAGGEATPQSGEDVKARGYNYYGGQAVTPPMTGGDVFALAANAPATRASKVVPTGDWAGRPDAGFEAPLVEEVAGPDQDPVDPATVGEGNG